ncbi:hypothetical protein K503DRAFT_782990 [Rhizopogon vinicolor AM-OR11-026]|uniref:Uncharacterized protein n=1 Tax=Rhizopogon vinicolor AM-OR11-026 TaxID=1314800 RepID=A0A1B7N099_9AGAM|nr:hypothetical protein K503DRAFT_782990 [Rhizopogon vinicolor AM-OR11-026]
MSYPEVHIEHARTTCDFMNAGFVIDEYSDVSGECEVREQKNIIIDALRNHHKPRPKEEWVGGEILRQWEHTIPYASVQSQKWFIAAFDKTLEEQAREDDGHNIVTIAMHKLDTDVNSAMLWVANHCTDLEKKLLEAMEDVSQWGQPIDSQSERYFGTKGEEIKRQR